MDFSKTAELKNHIIEAGEDNTNAEKPIDIRSMLNDSNFLSFYSEHATIPIEAAHQIYMKKKYQKYIDEHMKHRTVWEASNGKWKTRLTGQDGKARIVERSNKEDLLDLIVQHYRSLESRPSAKLVFDLWVNERLTLGEVQKNTCDRFELDFRKFFVNGEENRPIDEFTEDRLTDLIRTRIVANNLTRKGWQNVKLVLCGMFEYAERKGYTQINIEEFMRHLKLAKGLFRDVDHDKPQIFTDEEAMMIFNWIMSEPERRESLTNLGILLTFFTGLRAGELSSLKVSDFSGKTLEINKTEIRYKAADDSYIYEIRDRTKGAAGKRIVNLPDEACIVMQQILKVRGEGEYLFTHPDGTRIKGARFSEKLKRICKYVGIQERSLHKIRKTYASILRENGIDDTLIISQMGHTNIQTTEQFYIKNRDSAKQKAEKINTVFQMFPATVSELSQQEPTLAQRMETA